MPVGITAHGGVCVTSSSEQLVEGQATYGMANLRPERTGLPSSRRVATRDMPRA